MNNKTLYRIEGTKGNYSIWIGGHGCPWCTWALGVRNKNECNKIIKRLKENNK